MKARFICNMPNDPPLEGQEWVGDLVDGSIEPVFVNVDEGLPRVGNNVIGPPHGSGADPDDKGIYQLCE